MIQQRPHRWHVSILPTAIAGRWAIALALVSLAALWFHTIMVDMGERGDGWGSNWLLSGPILLTLFAAVAGLIAAIVSVVRGRELSVLLVLPIVWGLIVTSFTLGELVYPH